MIFVLLRRRSPAILLSIFMLVSFSLFPPTGPAGGVSPEASLSITAPRDGETLLAGQSYTVAWTYTGDVGRYARIQLYKGGQFKTTISSYTSVGSDGAGTYSWKISSTLAEGDDYQIKITSTSKSTVFVMSSSFRVRQASQSVSPTVSGLPVDVSKILPLSEQKQSSSQVSDEDKPSTAPAAAPPRSETHRAGSILRWRRAWMPARPGARANPSAPAPVRPGRSLFRYRPAARAAHRPTDESWEASAPPGPDRDSVKGHKKAAAPPRVTRPIGIIIPCPPHGP